MGQVPEGDRPRPTGDINWAALWQMADKRV